MKTSRTTTYRKWAAGSLVAWVLVGFQGCKEPAPCLVDCCDGSSIDLGGQADESQCLAAGAGTCNGSHGGVSSVDFDDTIVQDNESACPDIASNCAVTCCDSSYVVLGEQPSAIQCLAASGGECSGSHAGVASVDFDDTTVLDNESACAGSSTGCEVTCCDGTYADLGDQPDANQCVAASNGACNGIAGGVASVDFDAVTVYDNESACPAPPSWLCTAECCDGTIDGLDSLPAPADANQCIFWGGALCANHGGPISLTLDDVEIWQSQFSCPSTLRPCSGTCCDGKSIAESQQYDPNVCALVTAGACSNNGGWATATFAGVTPPNDWGCKAIPPLGSTSNCLALCCDGSTADGGTQSDPNQCIFWGGGSCGSHGGPVFVKHKDQVVWNHSTECSTLRPCTVHCNDGSAQTIPCPEPGAHRRTE